jgi:hypothetical protein
MPFPGDIVKVAHVGGVVRIVAGGRCRAKGTGCGRPILLGRTPYGRLIPIDPVPNSHGYYIAHWATCPFADRLKRRGSR